MRKNIVSLLLLSATLVGCAAPGPEKVRASLSTKNVELLGGSAAVINYCLAVNGIKVEYAGAYNESAGKVMSTLLINPAVYSRTYNDIVKQLGQSMKSELRTICKEQVLPQLALAKEKMDVEYEKSIQSTGSPRSSDVVRGPIYIGAPTFGPEQSEFYSLKTPTGAVQCRVASSSYVSCK